MAKSFTQPPIVVDNGANDLSVTFYVSDAASGNTPRVAVQYMHNGQIVRVSDHAVSEYSTLTPTQKTNLRSMHLAIRDETFTLDGAI